MPGEDNEAPTAHLEKKRVVFSVPELKIRQSPLPSPMNKTDVSPDTSPPNTARELLTDLTPRKGATQRPLYEETYNPFYKKFKRASLNPQPKVTEEETLWIKDFKQGFLTDWRVSNFLLSKTELSSKLCRLICWTLPTVILPIIIAVMLLLSKKVAFLEPHRLLHKAIRKKYASSTQYRKNLLVMKLQVSSTYRCGTYDEMPYVEFRLFFWKDEEKAQEIQTLEIAAKVSIFDQIDLENGMARELEQTEAGFSEKQIIPQMKLELSGISVCRERQKLLSDSMVDEMTMAGLIEDKWKKMMSTTNSQPRTKKPWKTSLESSPVHREVNSKNKENNELTFGQYTDQNEHAILEYSETEEDQNLENDQRLLNGILTREMSQKEVVYASVLQQDVTVHLQKEKEVGENREPTKGMKLVPSDILEMVGLSQERPEEEVETKGQEQQAEVKQSGLPQKPPSLADLSTSRAGEEESHSNEREENDGRLKDPIDTLYTKYKLLSVNIFHH